MDQQTGYLILLLKAALAASLAVAAIIASDFATGNAKIYILIGLALLIIAYGMYARSRPMHIRQKNRDDVRRLWKGPLWGHALIGVIVYGAPMVWLGNRQALAQGQSLPIQILLAGLASGVIFGVAMGLLWRKIAK